MLARIAELRPTFARLWRYGVTSVVATAVSEFTLLVLYGTGVLGATAAAVAANLAGTVPSYALSRYWIWREADRSNPGRQAAVYWLISIVSLVISSALTGLAAANAPGGHTAHVVVVGVAYVATYAVLWLAKFVIYQRVVFRSRERGSRGASLQPDLHSSHTAPEGSV